ncbi:Tetratricopeptide repeat protein 33 [Rhynchospora pubera]|uniref:Tetratricopeptide repeat protein 33 n=1 Tax=Rhynchospora pubera TaxID=906938 RepID=A0AAV8CLH7_9POAL|nr:Tetratricopeptide repeat protein 33 [Rhynchospora pubera]
MPENEIIHEQKAQVLLELGDAWNSLKAATRATQLKLSWPEAWVTLGRAQLNYGEPDSAIESFDKALALKQFHISEANVGLRTFRSTCHSLGFSTAMRVEEIRRKLGGASSGEGGVGLEEEAEKRQDRPVEKGLAA